MKTSLFGFMLVQMIASHAHAYEISTTNDREYVISEVVCDSSTLFGASVCTLAVGGDGVEATQSNVFVDDIKAILARNGLKEISDLNGFHFFSRVDQDPWAAYRILRIEGRTQSAYQYPTTEQARTEIAKRLANLECFSTLEIFEQQVLNTLGDEKYMPQTLAKVSELSNGKVNIIDLQTKDFPTRFKITDGSTTISYEWDWIYGPICKR
jgi:hypothetical protein